MMKKSLIIFFLFLSVNFVNAQFSQVYLADTAIQDLDFDEDTLYFVTQGGSGIAGKLAKIENFDSASPNVTILSDQLGLYPRAIEIANNVIYFSNTSKLRKLDLNQATPTPEDIVSANSVRAIFYRNNIVYLAENDKISKVDLTETNPVKVDLISGLEFAPLSLAAYDNELFIAYGYKISKFNMDDNTPVLEDVLIDLPSRSYGIDFNGEDLYIAQIQSQDNSDLIKINVNETPIIITELPVQVTNTISLLGLNFFNDDLYAGRAVEKDIIKIESSILNIDEVLKHNLNVQVVPNPTSNSLMITNLTSKKEYLIIDMNGKAIQKGVLVPNRSLNIEHLAKGLYVLTIENEQQLKFIKN